jgi:hypothetical protein
MYTCLSSNVYPFFHLSGSSFIFLLEGFDNTCFELYFACHLSAVLGEKGR